VKISILSTEVDSIGAAAINMLTDTPRSMSVVSRIGVDGILASCQMLWLDAGVLVGMGDIDNLKPCVYTGSEISREACCAAIDIFKRIAVYGVVGQLVASSGLFDEDNLIYMDAAQVDQQVKKMCDRNLSIMVERGRKYSNENLSDVGVTGIHSRMHDKTCRMRNILQNKLDDGGESVIETMGDMSNYAIISILVLRGLWGRIEEDGISTLLRSTNVPIISNVPVTPGKNDDAHGVELHDGDVVRMLHGTTRYRLMSINDGFAYLEGVKGITDIKMLVRVEG